MITKLLCTAAFAAMAAAATPAVAQNNVMFIFDASGSMLRDAGGESRVSAAKRVFGETLANVPPSVRVGLMAYGHRRSRDCSDIEVLSPIGAEKASTLSRHVVGIEARGETPIAESLRQAGRAFQPLKGQNNQIVLITDGIEECRGDPCAVAEELAGLGVDLKVNVVGFTLEDRQRQLLQCVVDKTGGRYFDAKDAGALQTALKDVQLAVVQEPAPKEPPRAPAPPRELFADDFNGTKPGEHWRVINEKEDTYIVENGELLISNSGEAGFRQAKTSNIFQLNQPLPAGDFDLVLDMKPTLATGRDSVWLGVYQDDKNFVAAHLSNSTGYCSELVVSIVRRSGGEETSSRSRIAGSSTCGFGNEDVPALAKRLAEKGGKLVLSKRGRRVTATAVLNAGVFSDALKVVSTAEASVVRLSGQPAFAVGQFEAQKGETLMTVNRFTILAPAGE